MIIETRLGVQRTRTEHRKEDKVTKRRSRSKGRRTNGMKRRNRKERWIKRRKRRKARKRAARQFSQRKKELRHVPLAASA